ERAQGLRQRAAEPGKHFRGGRWSRRGGGEVGIFERSLAPGAAMVVYVPLGEGRTQPAHERSSSGVRGQGRTPLAVALVEPKEFGVERIGELLSKRGRSGHRNGGLRERSSKALEKLLPR